MITDSQSKTWTPNPERSEWTREDGGKILVNAAANDEQVLMSINELLAQQSAPIKTDAERIADLEAKLADLLARLS